jgi:hypothetical protein
MEVKMISTTKHLGEAEEVGTNQREAEVKVLVTMISQILSRVLSIKKPAFKEVEVVGEVESNIKLVIETMTMREAMVHLLSSR